MRATIRYALPTSRSPITRGPLVAAPAARPSISTCAPGGTVWTWIAVFAGPKIRGHAANPTRPSAASTASVSTTVSTRPPVLGALGWRRSIGCDAPAGSRFDGPDASRPAASIFPTENPMASSWTFGLSRSNVHTASVATPGSTLKYTPVDELVIRYRPRPAPPALGARFLFNNQERGGGGG